MKDYELIITKVITCNYKYVNITYFTSYLYYLALRIAKIILI
jgi:hypothetical protein